MSENKIQESPVDTQDWKALSKRLDQTILEAEAAIAVVDEKLATYSDDYAKPRSFLQETVIKEKLNDRLTVLREFKDHHKGLSTEESFDSESLALLTMKLDSVDNLIKECELRALLAEIKLASLYKKVHDLKLSMEFTDCITPTERLAAGKPILHQLARVLVTSLEEIEEIINGGRIVFNQLHQELRVVNNNLFIEMLNLANDILEQSDESEASMNTMDGLEQLHEENNKLLEVDPSLSVGFEGIIQKLQQQIKVVKAAMSEIKKH